MKLLWFVKWLVGPRFYFTGGGSDASATLRADQQAQEARINQGLAQLKAIFEGGEYLNYSPATSYSPGQTYYTETGPGQYAKFDPTPLIQKYQAQQAQQPQKPDTSKWFVDSQGYLQKPQSTPQVPTEQLVNTAMQGGGSGSCTGPSNLKLFTATPTRYEGFTPEFYQKRQQAYEQFAMPQVNQQFNMAQSRLGASMANKGLLNSSAARGLQNSLMGEKALQTQNVANQGLALSQDLQDKIASQRNTLTSQLMASANPQAVATQALGSISQLSAPSPMSSLGPLFNNWMNTYLASNLSNQYNQYNQQQNALSPYRGTPVNTGENYTSK